MNTKPRPNPYALPVGAPTTRPLTKAEAARRARLALWTKPLGLLPAPSTQGVAK